MSSEEIPWFRPQVDDAEQRAVSAVLASGYFNDGEVARQFEREVAKILGLEHCIAVTSGTAAISLALMAHGIGAGDEVIVPDLTFIATANAVRLCGATPVLADIESERLTIDIAAAEAAITSRTRAIVPVDVNGRGPNYDALADLCAAHDLVMVCDSAEALGSAWKGQPLGTFGSAGCFSFTPAKTICTGQGGMIAVHDAALKRRLVELKDQGRAAGGTGGDDLHPVVGFNFKFTNLQAAIGLAQLEKLPRRLQHFRARRRWYEERLAGCEGVRLPPVDESGGETLQWIDAMFESRSVVSEHLKANGIGFRPFWFPLHTQKASAQPGQFPNAAHASQQGLWLPSSFALTESEVDRICGVIRRALGQ